MDIDCGHTEGQHGQVLPSSDSSSDSQGEAKNLILNTISGQAPKKNGMSDLLIQILSISLSTILPMLGFWDVGGLGKFHVRKQATTLRNSQTSRENLVKSTMPSSLEPVSNGTHGLQSSMGRKKKEMAAFGDGARYYSLVELDSSPVAYADGPLSTWILDELPQNAWPHAVVPWKSMLPRKRTKEEGVIGKNKREKRRVWENHGCKCPLKNKNEKKKKMNSPHIGR